MNEKVAYLLTSLEDFEAGDEERLIIMNNIIRAYSKNPYMRALWIRIKNEEFQANKECNDSCLS